MPQNASEALVSRLVTQTCLSLWSYANPLNSEGKELCDALVVCDPHVILVSVKEVMAKPSTEPELGWERWSRKAIEASAAQLYGAERELQRLDRVRLRGGGFGLPLPAADARRVHRVAVAFGSDGRTPFLQGDLGRGFVHVFDEVALDILLKELDTVVDLTRYLEAKEELVMNGAVLQVAGEENLLAFYLHRGRSFPGGADSLIIGDDVWSELSRKPEWKARKDADRDSYVWDYLIEWIARDIRSQACSDPNALAQKEEALRVLNREPRFARRVLGKVNLEFLEEARRRTVRARIARSPSGVAYVFLACQPEVPRDQRAAELAARCFVARGMMPGTSTVAGIATEVPGSTKHTSVDLAVLRKEDWTGDDEARCQALREAGLFRTPRRTAAHEDEFPAAGRGPRAAESED